MAPGDLQINATPRQVNKAPACLCPFTRGTHTSQIQAYWPSYGNPSMCPLGLTQPVWFPLPSSSSSKLFFFLIMIFIFSIIADLQCFVNFPLYSKVTQSHIHVHILFSHIIMLHHKWPHIVPSATQQDPIQASSYSFFKTNRNVLLDQRFSNSLVSGPLYTFTNNWELQDFLFMRVIFLDIHSVFYILYKFYIF